MTDEQTREQFIALFSHMVAALVMSRVVAEFSPNLSDEILDANTARLKQA